MSIISDEEAKRLTKLYMKEVYPKKPYRLVFKGKRPIYDRIYEQYKNGTLQWLESRCNGIGFNMGCGDIVIADSIGVDVILPLCSNDSVNEIIQCDMNDVSSFDDECADYIISNYIGVIRCPVITFCDWFRILKPGGIIAFVCQNAEHSNYINTNYGPLSKTKRGKIKVFSCYSSNIINYYLRFAGFISVIVEKHKDKLFVKAIKK